MTLTIGSLTFTALTAQPYGYDENDTRAGLTARKWKVDGLCTPSEWQSLLSVYDTWRNTRITDADTKTSGVIGTTVALSATANGITFTSVPCWFISAPSGEQLGAYVQASCELVDANQGLQVLLRAEEKSTEPPLLFGTFAVGSATITLTQPPATFQDLPPLAMTAGGTHYITGAPAITTLYQIEGYCDSTNWAALQTWISTTASSATRPATGSLYPLSIPTPSAENAIENGVKVIRYKVSMQIAEVK
jgi:hypothetical protein